MRERRLAKFPADYFDVIVVDEAHHVLSDGYQRVLAHFGGAKVLGVTATPDRGNMRNLGQYFEHLAYEYTLPRAIKEGYLCPIRAVTIPLKLDLTGVGVQAGDFKNSDIDTALDPYLQQIAQEMHAYCENRKTVVFLPLVRTSQKFRDILNAQGFRAAEVNGDSRDRAEVLRDFEAGKYDVLCNSMLLTEGWDCPGVDCVVVLRPTKIRSLYSQMVGRGTRLAPGKEDLLLLDFLWHTERHELCHPANLICESDEVARMMTENIEAAGCPVDIEEAERKASEDVVAQREEALAKQLSEMRSRKRKLVDPLQFEMSIAAQDLSGYVPSFGYAGLSAPGESELEDEYPSAGPMTRAFIRKIAQTNSRITKTAEAITLRIEGNEESIQATLDLIDGFTVTDSSGSTKIKGSSIETGSIAANSISADKLNLTGAITFGDLTLDTRYKIDTAYSDAQSAQEAIAGWTYPGTTYIDGSSLMTGTVKASSLQGGSVSLLSSNAEASGMITITPAATGAYALDITSYAALRIRANSGNLYLQAGGVALNLSSAGINTVGADFFSIDRTYSLGTLYSPWAAVYASTGEIITSDRDQKHGIEYGLQQYDKLFDLLRPASYLLNSGVSGRRHVGMIAQDVEAAMGECGLTGMEFAGLVKAPRKNEEGQTMEGEYDYSLRYEEFIPICIEQIQKLKKRVSELERGIAG